MAQIVFLRGVNVGGNKTFRPSTLAAELADLDVVNVGAAGTFVVRSGISQSNLRTELAGRLPFQAEMMICRDREILDLAAEDPFPEEADDGVTRYVSVLAKRPATLPTLPLCRPESDEWEVKVLNVPGRFALSFHRRIGRNILYPSQVVEKCFGVPSTTRNWNTIAAICKILQGS
jgi:uncharacterized protein (DUF1697 family)